MKPATTKSAPRKRNVAKRPPAARPPMEPQLTITEGKLKYALSQWILACRLGDRVESPASLARRDYQLAAAGVAHHVWQSLRDIDDLPF